MDSYLLDCEPAENAAYVRRYTQLEKTESAIDVGYSLTETNPMRLLIEAPGLHQFDFSHSRAIRGMVNCVVGVFSLAAS